MKLNQFILKKVENSTICYLLRMDYRCVHQGTEESCQEYAKNSPGIIKKIIQ
jgi:hypothetical protein